mmetsp:Transcript_23043/g.74152  ORF Transcript_23043/g.74152 Transcript_23043/m.74152 type:complete len:288 (+) Transcript_23043:272-1135(+)
MSQSMPPALGLVRRLGLVMSSRWLAMTKAGSSALGCSEGGGGVGLPACVERGSYRSLVRLDETRGEGLRTVWCFAAEVLVVEVGAEVLASFASDFALEEAFGEVGVDFGLICPPRSVGDAVAPGPEEVGCDEANGVARGDDGEEGEVPHEPEDGASRRLVLVDVCLLDELLSSVEGDGRDESQFEEQGWHDAVQVARQAGPPRLQHDAAGVDADDEDEDVDGVGHHQPLGTREAPDTKERRHQEQQTERHVQQVQRQERHRARKRTQGTQALTHLFLCSLLAHHRGR